MFNDAQIANGGYKIYPKIVANRDEQHDDKFLRLYNKSRKLKLFKMLCSAPLTKLEELRTGLVLMIQNIDLQEKQELLRLKE